MKRRHFLSLLVIAPFAGNPPVASEAKAAEHGVITQYIGSGFNANPDYLQFQPCPAFVCNSRADLSRHMVQTSGPVVLDCRWQ